MATKTKAQRKPTPTPRKPAARAPRPRQPSLPTLDAPKHPDVERAADAYVEIRDSRMDLTKQETAAQATLLAAMQGHALTVYRLDTDEGTLLVTVEDESKVHVRKEREKKARTAREGDA